LEVTDEEWWASLNLNFLAAVRTTRAALPMMLKRGAGSINYH
jgi:NAD(P)-dependent dehydrogenase (short-subunit alcohol dehydrogenase family)